MLVDHHAWLDADLARKDLVALVGVHQRLEALALAVARDHVDLAGGIVAGTTVDSGPTSPADHARDERTPVNLAGFRGGDRQRRRRAALLLAARLLLLARRRDDGDALGLNRRGALDDTLARLVANQPLLDREHRAPRRARALLLDDAQEAGFERLLRDAQRLEHAVRRILEHVGEHVVAVEHAQHAVDLRRHLLAEVGHALNVLLEHHRRRQQLGALAHTLEEALGVGEQLVGAHRDLPTPHDVLAAEVEARVGPQQQLVKRGLAVDQPDLRRRDLAAVEPDLAATQAADHRQHGAAPERGERANQREDAGGLGQAAGDVIALARWLTAQRSGRSSRRRAGTPDALTTSSAPAAASSSPWHARADEHDRRIRRQKLAGPANQLDARLRCCRRPATIPPSSASRRANSARSAGIACAATGMPSRSNPSWICRRGPGIGIEHDDFRRSRHARTCKYNARRRTPVLRRLTHMIVLEILHGTAAQKSHRVTGSVRDDRALAGEHGHRYRLSPLRRSRADHADRRALRVPRPALDQRLGRSSATASASRSTRPRAGSSRSPTATSCCSATATIRCGSPCGSATSPTTSSAIA